MAGILYIVGVTATKDHRDKFSEVADSLPWDEEGLYDVTPYTFGIPGARYIEMDKFFLEAHSSMTIVNMIEDLTGVTNAEAFAAFDEFHLIRSALNAGLLPKGSVVLRIYQR